MIKLVERKKRKNSFTFEVIDLDCITNTFPKDVSELLLCENDFTYRLSYKMFDKTFIKYFSKNRNSLSKTTNMANEDAEIDENGLDPRSCVDLVMRSDRLSDNIKIPSDTLETIKTLVNNYYPNGECSNASNHLMQTVHTGKKGHDLFPNKLFDNWFKRYKETSPLNFNFIFEPIGLDVIVIPVSSSYFGKCKELEELGNLAYKRTINVLPPIKRQNFELYPGLQRVVSCLKPFIVTQYFKIANLKNTKTNIAASSSEDENVKPIPLNIFNESIIKEVVEIYSEYLHDYR